MGTKDQQLLGLSGEQAWMPKVIIAATRLGHLKAESCTGLDLFWQKMEKHILLIIINRPR